MRKISRYILLFTLGAAVFAAAVAEPRQQSPPESALAPPVPLEVRYADSSLAALVDSTANVIVDSCGTLTAYIDKLVRIQGGADEVVSILHIGDSHVQAGYFTGRVRKLFQEDFGSAGRGLITPYRLAGMNEPRDFSMQTVYPYHADRATARDIEADMGPTGVALIYQTPAVQMKIWSKEPFDGITVIHHDKAPLLNVPDSLDIDMSCDLDDTRITTRIALPCPVDSLELKGFVYGERTTPTYYGFSLERGCAGVIYHEVGLNGAAFEHFMNKTTVADGGLAGLRPDLIIVSLGTNNCYGTGYREEAFARVVDTFLSRLTESYDGVPVVMTTPMESCRRVRSRREPNPNIESAADVIRNAANAHSVALWDMYGAAGGKGANAEWTDRKLFAADRIHLTEAGYTLQGDMLYDAFTRYYNLKTRPEHD